MEEQSSGAKLFFFPDESFPLQDQPSKPLPQVTQELGDITYLAHKSSDTDDEFCFVGDEAGLGILVSIYVHNNRCIFQLIISDVNSPKMVCQKFDGLQKIPYG